HAALPLRHGRMRADDGRAIGWRSRVAEHWRAATTRRPQTGRPGTDRPPSARTRVSFVIMSHAASTNVADRMIMEACRPDVNAGNLAENGAQPDALADLVGLWPS